MKYVTTHMTRHRQTATLATKRRLTALVLCAALALCLSACGAKSTPNVGSGAGNADADNASGADSPPAAQGASVALGSWDDLHAALGLPMAAPAGAQNVQYAVVEGDVAQITFDFGETGHAYTLRGCTRGGYLSGMQGAPLQSTKSPVVAGDVITQLETVPYSDMDMVFQWTQNGVGYTLAARYRQQQPVVRHPPDVAAACVQITTTAANPADLQAYVKATHETVGAQQGLPTYAMQSYQLLDEAALVREMQQNEWPEGKQQAFLGVLHTTPDAQLARVEMKMVQQNGEERQLVLYDLLCKAENGAYYIGMTVT